MRPTGTMTSSAHGMSDSLNLRVTLFVRILALTFHRFYNTTYTVFASSMILLYMAQVANIDELPALSRYVEMAIEILEVMDESIIAIKSAGMIKRALDRVKEASAPPLPVTPALHDDLWLPTHHYWGSVNLLDGQLDEGFPFQICSWLEEPEE